MKPDAQAFELPAITAEARPEFNDAETCSEWLRTLPLINVTPSHARLLGQLEEFNCFDIAPAERLRVLELLTEPAEFLQLEHAKKITGKPVPLTERERHAFLNILALWDALSLGYQRCLQALDRGATGLSAQAALLCQRILWCSSQRMAEHYKVNQEIGGEDWQLLHRVYAICESLGAAREPVGDASTKGHKTTGLQTYAAALLIHLANDPSENTPRQLALVSRWLVRWAPTIGIGEQPPASELDLPPLGVDPGSADGPKRTLIAGASARYLDLGPIAKIIRSSVAQLRKGATPASLGLGEDMSATAAEHLLLVAHRGWCEGTKPRATARRPVSTRAQVCSSYAALHFHVTGKPFRQPVHAKELSKSEREEIATFGRIATRQEDAESLQQRFVLENWIISEESLGGLRIERTEEGGSGRYVQQQLVAVRPSDARSYLIGVVRWLLVSGNFVLRAGVRVLPGIPQGVAIRSTGINAASEIYVPALLLTAVAALQSPATLILPPGWYRPRRVIEVYSDKAEQFLLTGVLERGTDFERVGFGAA